RLQRFAKLEQLDNLSGPELLHEGPAVGEHVDEAVALEHPEHLADRGPADAETVDERALRQRRARHQLAGDDLIGKSLEHRVLIVLPLGDGFLALDGLDGSSAHGNQPPLLRVAWGRGPILRGSVGTTAPSKTTRSPPR